jgi:O-antigen/teichoic acid export membrane protein
MNKLIQKHGIKILYVATIVSLGASFFGSVLNSRLLSKESFGDWKYLQSFIAFIGYFANFGLYSSGGRLIAATNDKKKIRIYKGYMLYFAFIGLSIITLSAITTGLFFPKLLNETLFHLVLIMFPFFIIHPLNFYFECTFQGEGKMMSLAVFRCVPPSIYVVMLYAFKSHSAGSVYYNAILYYVSYFVTFLILIWYDKPIFKWNTNEWKDLRLQHKTFGIHIYWGALWTIGAIQLLPILVGFFNINNIEVGHYSLALSFIMPLSFLPSIVGTSYFKKYIKLPTIPRAAFRKVIFSSLLLLVALLLGIDYVIDFFLGAKYKEVSALIKIGSFGAILHGFADFVNKFLLAKGESIFLKKVSMVTGVVQLSSSLVLIHYFSATGAIIAKSIGSLLFFCALFFYYHKKYIVQKFEGHSIKITQDESPPLSDVISG